MALFGSPAMLANGGGQQPVVNNFTGSGTWCCCPGAKLIQVIAIGGGGGGGASANYCATGCPTFYISGGQGGGGGGISMTCFTAGQVCSTAVVTVGAGGSQGAPATNGCNSCFVSGTAIVCAQGGERGNYSTVQNNQPTSGLGVGGLGNYSQGNCGGIGWATCPGGNGTSSETTRAGAGGGGAYYCNLLGCVPVFTNRGEDSPVADFETPQTAISLNDYGRGGKGGNGSMNSQRTPAGTNGEAGYVRVIQYF
jgi:hypothetical protein